MKYEKRKAMMLTVLVTGVAAYGAGEAGTGMGEGIKINESLALKPFAEGNITHDSNIQRSKNAESDVFWQYAIGTKLSKETDTIEFDSSVWWSQRMYDKFSDQDADRLGAAAYVRGESDKTFGSVTLDYKQVDDYDQAPAFGSVPTGFEGTLDRLFDRSVSEKRALMDFSGGFGYKMSDDTSMLLAARYYDVNYDNANILSWSEVAGGLELATRMTDKTAGYADFQVGVLDGDAVETYGDTMRYVARIGVKNSLTDKSSLRLGVGVEQFSYGDESETQPSIDAVANWQATEKVGVFAFGRNEIQPTGSNTNLQNSLRSGIGARWAATEKLSCVLSGGIMHNAYITSNTPNNDKPSSLLEVVTLRASYNALAGLDVFAAGEFTNADQDSYIGDDYDRFRASLGLLYRF